ncbi:hypothetical protein DAPPUDRAFT_220681 [Daphnia pulex]|uniref:Cuticular protein n=1 Tax=Daphnia pulex TaxID=6669 RepID=E9FV18_DAPPU|nr:hypothetical protein DAPPUDRAFT_220681 [Daphnia pulex]|eukprot:EFX89182.1 hypothetical protein DAPPUDRAFT_220681 [Daphnia pulex]
MKVLILSFFLACASAQYYPGFYGPGFTSQYHAQDVLGQASYGFSHPGQAAAHYRDAFGNQVGSYAYINPVGKEVMVSYTADSRGFRVASNDLPESPVAPVVLLKSPEPVQETPEVAEAKAKLFALQKEASAKRTKRQVPVYPAALPYTPYTPAFYSGALPAIKHVAPWVAPAPLFTKTTLKTVTAEADPSAKTPADTTKFDLKEKSFDVVTPVAYPYAPYGYTYPFAAPVAAPVEVSRKKRQVTVFPYPSAVYGATFPTPLVAKTTLKTVTAEADPSAKTPADTTKFDLKEKSFDVVTPVAYPYYAPYGYTYPNAYPQVNGFY